MFGFLVYALEDLSSLIGEFVNQRKKWPKRKYLFRAPLVKGRKSVQNNAMFSKRSDRNKKGLNRSRRSVGN